MIFSLVVGYFPINVLAEEEPYSFAENWKFVLDDPEEARFVEYDDSSWQTVTIPHDWSNALEYSYGADYEVGYKPGGIGWYRKSFVMDANDEGKRVVIRFGGVYQNSTVYINGHKLGDHPYGYTAFSYDLSKYLIYDGKTENVLAVRVDNYGNTSRWYAGSGINRHVTLTVGSPVYVDYNKSQILIPDLTDTSNTARVLWNGRVYNTTNEDVETVIHARILDPQGEVVAEATFDAVQIDANSNKELNYELTVANLQFWSPEIPNVYEWNVELLQKKNVVDSGTVDFGFKTIRFDENTGFWLNGKSYKLQGVCLHENEGMLGSVENRDALVRKLTALKDLGVNAIRMTHNPSSDTMLDLCNHMGFFVIEEAFDTWSLCKNANYQDYSASFLNVIEEENEILYGHDSSEEITWAEFDLKEMVDHARNNPSTLMWSIGNEILGNIWGDTSDYPKIAENLVRWVREEDQTLRITIGDNMPNNGRDMQTGFDQTIMANYGVIGWNYADARTYDQKHQTYPDWPMYGSEIASALNTRGEYSGHGILEDLWQVSAYDGQSVEWGSGAQQAWLPIAERDFVSGGFLWIAYDYLGEPEPWNEVGDYTIGPKNSYFGILDTAGIPKDSYYFWRSVWNQNDTTLHLLPTWNREDLDISSDGYVEVVVYTNATSAELFLNGNSLGRKTYEVHTTENGYTYRTYGNEMSFSWNVPYEEGSLEVKAYDDHGDEITETVGRHCVTTSTSASKIMLTSDRNELHNDGESLAFIIVSVTDDEGNVINGANDRITFTVEGEGRLVGMDNGNSVDLDSFVPESEHFGQRSVFHGQQVIAVQSSKNAGEITIIASSENLTSATLTIRVVADVVETKKDHNPRIVILVSLGLLLCVLVFFQQRWLTKVTQKQK